VRSETVFVKTARGIEELEHRALGLGATTRRLLILIDGHRTVAQLIHDNAGSMDVSSALEELRSHGLIAEQGHEAEQAAPASAKSAGSPRQALTDLARTVLGDKYAERIASKLSALDSDDPDELSQVVDNCVRLIRLTIDENKAEDFRRQADVILRALR
jgi:hypothetical protein